MFISATIMISTYREMVLLWVPFSPCACSNIYSEPRSLVPQLNVYINFWRRYVDDTIPFVKIRSVKYLLSVLNNFHPKIKFAYEMEAESK